MSMYHDYDPEKYILLKPGVYFNRKGYRDKSILVVSIEPCKRMWTIKMLVSGESRIRTDLMITPSISKLMFETMNDWGQTDD